MIADNGLLLVSTMYIAERLTSLSSLHQLLCILFPHTQAIQYARDITYTVTVNQAY